VDSGNDRVLRLDITSGSATGTFSPYENIAESSIYSGYTSSVFVSSGLTEPSGIDIIGNRMIVSDHSTGEIIIYDIAGITGVELVRIQTGSSGVMGVKVGPDGKIWYVNATTNQVVRLEFVDVAGIEDISKESSVNIYPNPTEGNVININTNIVGSFSLKIMDITGQVINEQLMNQQSVTVDVSSLPAGSYFIQIIETDNGNVLNRKFSISR
jgi:hypothetical protein